MLNSDRSTEGALLPVAIVNGAGVGAFAAFPADIFAATPISDGEVVSGVAAGGA